jgi:hypothetical protein
MMPTRIEFRMNVDKGGYRYVAAKPTLAPGQSILDVPVRDVEPERIVGRGGSRIAKRLSQYPMLFTEFANVRSYDELLAFIAEYGSLTKRNEIPKLLDTAEEMRAWISKEKSPLWSVADLKASLVRDRASGTAVISYSPTTLLDALWLQLAQALSGGTQFRQCEQCNIPFPVGGKSGRRLVARFCSDKCRIEFNSLERTRRKRSRK